MMKRPLKYLITISKNKSLIIDFNLNYFNSSSAKQFIQLISLLEEDSFSGKVLWRYPNDHIIMYDRGKELEAILDVPFEFISSNTSLNSRNCFCLVSSLENAEACISTAQKGFPG